ncbi:flagellar protein FlaG protein [Thermodesulfatator indicus DSM 15286]|uniref:Flagellar protein FlaG protein n=1 Tax=Thermodesulfatator indicus (strain DSM 15286 / JCM 11887 / CIR29812) TaxID=667014 RepID=F8AAT0_THEID|nr:flagellar protein FlaG [Thermodesulfatator indicus]AEH45441.1 flagellar protein FlaG protein [Thermodesulfatator indicus DSM 15286]
MQISRLSTHNIEAISQSQQPDKDFPRSASNEVFKEKIENKMPEDQKRPESYENIVKTIQKELEQLNVRLVISVDKDTKDFVVKVIDPQTDEIIRQIPPQELLEIRKKLDELVGILFDARV